MTRENSGSVQLADQRSASSILHSVLVGCVAKFPQTFPGSLLPKSAAVFRDKYSKLLPQFEVSRLASPDRSLIAHHLAGAIQNHLILESEGGSLPLGEALKVVGTPLPLQTREPGRDPGWQPRMVYRGERWEAVELANFGKMLVERNIITREAGQSLTWISEHPLASGRLDLSGRKIVMLGAGAEMAPTQYFLEAGAEVLWLDITLPSSKKLEARNIAGRLHWPEHGADLLGQPQDILATILKFADGQPVDLGLYAYAPGQARELRLTGSMNAIVNALPASAIASVTMLVSPTTPVELGEHDLAAMAARRQTRPGWEALLDSTRLLGGDGCERSGYVAATRTVVGIQGASYQAAQYLGKVMMAECWANHGNPDAVSPSPFRVSGNTAAITRTRSLDHPVFAAALQGASALGVETFTPRLSRSVNGLLAVRDWLSPDPPEPGKVRVHGGIHTLPYPLESALRVAAILGFARSPRLLRGLLR